MFCLSTLFEHSATSCMSCVCCGASVCILRVLVWCSEVNEECLKCSRNVVQFIFLFTLKLVSKPFKGHFEPLQIIHNRQRRWLLFIVTFHLFILPAIWSAPSLLPRTPVIQVSCYPGLFILRSHVTQDFCYSELLLLRKNSCHFVIITIDLQCTCNGANVLTYIVVKKVNVMCHWPCG